MLLGRFSTFLVVFCSCYKFNFFQKLMFYLTTSLSYSFMSICLFRIIDKDYFLFFYEIINSAFSEVLRLSCSRFTNIPITDLYASKMSRQKIYLEFAAVDKLAYDYELYLTFNYAFRCSGYLLAQSSCNF